GRIACRLADRVFVTSDNPRSESPAQIMAHIETGCSGDYTLVEDRGQAIAMAIADAASGDCILIAGKGHEEYQQLDEKRIYFSDVAEASKALAGSSSR
ncbi:MAG: UDP-N-acetylmuramoyl-L-alanyl-D-glutamate--2,6-diaminopimelate ligase, partial [Halieaceae bacterium]|nr:UDP-N-acetylmuramoyl-L-alanyl-D-glutamate--2,6-diaminopimelate ligase [Halieaceae bacterium]